MARKSKQKFKYLQALSGPVPLVGVSLCLLGIALLLPASPPVQKQSASYHTPTAHTAKKAVATPKATPVAAPVTTSHTSTTSVTPTPAATHTTTATPKPAPVVVPAPNSNVSSLVPTTPATSSGSSGNSNNAATISYTSTNWSGYLSATGSFSGISASWTAPHATESGLSTSADATWIGIGGVTAGDLIQVGTQNTVSAGGQVSTAAFYELLPNVSQPVPGVTVTAGDAITASLKQISSGQWTVSITDQTDGQSYTSTVSYASSLSSAEWIEEDPSYSSGRQVPFDNFGTVAFSGGATTVNGNSVDIAGSSAQAVAMVNRAGQTVATPSALNSDGASFSITRENE